MGNNEVGMLGQTKAGQVLGPNIQGEQIRWQTPDGNPTLDFLVRNRSTPSGFEGIEIKTGNATLTNPQEFGYPHLEAGTAVPVGRAARDAGLAVGQQFGPTPVNVWNYQAFELLPFSPELGSVLGLSTTTAGSQLLPDGRILQIDATGKHYKTK
jgi:hypothetical protein